MVTKQNIRKGLEISVSMTAIALLVSGCLGSNTTTNPPTTTTSLSGAVADGYLSGAKVCLDLNINSVCDAGEPSDITGNTGAYSITGIAATINAASYPIIAEVPATAVDADTNAAVGTAFTLTSPAGTSFVSPLTTLVHEKIMAGYTIAQANSAVVQALGVSASGVSALDNYIVNKGSAVDQTNAHYRAHEAAKTFVKALQHAKLAISSTSASTVQATQSLLVSEAENVLSIQAASNAAIAGAVFIPSAVNASSVSGSGTLRAAIAGANASAVAAAATQDVSIPFDVYNGTTQIGTTGCSTAFTLGTASTPGTLADLRFYVSNVSLIDAAGNYTPVVLTENDYQSQGVALLDFETATGSCSAMTGTPATWTAVTGKVAPGTYVGVAFTLGVPSKLNHTSTTASTTPVNLQNTAMNWSWNGGRKFTKIEFLPTVTGSMSMMGYANQTSVHLGSKNCIANPTNGDALNGCGRPNRVTYSFANGFDTSKKIALDLNVLLGARDLTTSNTWMSATTGPLFTYYFAKFGLDIATGRTITDVNSQSIFVIK
ncbi:MAG: MbnP family copper-binding protein [Gallionellaceae bacterium]|jgi:uncharacterized repeat protein (TIGR04052 family)